MIMSDLFIFSVLILSTITAFGAGYFCGLFRGSKKTMPDRGLHPVTPEQLGKVYDNTNNTELGKTLKEKPTHSSVLKMPTPEEIRKKKEKDSTQDYWNHLEGKKREKGTFRLETNDL